MIGIIEAFINEYYFRKWCREVDKIAKVLLHVDESYTKDILGLDEARNYYEDEYDPRELIDEELSYYGE